MSKLKRTVYVRELREMALNFIDREGYDNVTADDIARELSISRRTFFRYFPIKEDIVVGSFSHIGSALSRRLVAGVDGDQLSIVLMENCLIDHVGSDEFYTKNGRASFRLISCNKLLLQRFVSVISHSSAEISQGLISVGYSDTKASFAARLCITLLVEATERWSTTPGTSAEEHVRTVFADLNSIL